MPQYGDPKKCKVLLYDKAKIQEIEILLAEKFEWWEEEVQRRRDESGRSYVERIVLSFEAFLLREVVNRHVPCNYSKCV
jgi:hypothetical protein